MCLGIDINGGILVWGTSKEGVLGLGFDVTSVDIPTRLESLRDIIDVSISDNHAVAISSIGEAFSWGTGKYGELGLDKSIYTPTPLRLTNDKVYSKVFCSNLITCLLDSNGHFSYFGVIIKLLKGINSTITVKSLLNDLSVTDPKTLFTEKYIVELENEQFNSIVIGNGFIGLLSKKGTVFTLEYSDKLTMLYSKHFVYSITVAHNDIFGLSIEKTNNIPKSGGVPSNSKNYYLCKWNSKFPEKEVSSEIWYTTIYKISDDVHIQNLSLLNTNGNRGLILLMEKDSSSGGLNSSFLSPAARRSVDSNDISWDNITYNELPSNISRKGHSIDNFLIYDSEFDDSYNMKFKRSKSQSSINVGGNRGSRSLSPYMNKTMTNTTLINPTGNVLQRSNTNLSCILPNNSNKVSNTNLGGSARSNNAFITSEGNNVINTNNNDNVNYYDESIDMKEKELQSYKKEIDDIITNFRIRQKEQRNSLRNKYNTNTAKTNSTFTKNNDISQTAKSNHYRVQSSDLNLSFSTDLKRQSINLNTTPNNKKGNASKVKFLSIDKTIENKSNIYPHLDTSNINIETKNEIASDLEGFLNKTNNMDNDNSNIKNEIYSDIDDANLFNKTNNSNLFDECSQIKASGIKGNFLSPNNTTSLNKRYNFSTNNGNNATSPSMILVKSTQIIQSNNNDDVDIINRLMIESAFFKRSQSEKLFQHKTMYDMMKDDDDYDRNISEGNMDIKGKTLIKKESKLGHIMFNDERTKTNLNVMNSLKFSKGSDMMNNYIRKESSNTNEINHRLIDDFEDRNKRYTASKNDSNQVKSNIDVVRNNKNIINHNQIIENSNEQLYEDTPKFEKNSKANSVSSNQGKVKDFNETYITNKNTFSNHSNNDKSNTHSLIDNFRKIIISDPKEKNDKQQHSCPNNIVSIAEFINMKSNPSSSVMLEGNKTSITNMASSNSVIKRSIRKTKSLTNSSGIAPKTKVKRNSHHKKSRLKANSTSHENNISSDDNSYKNSYYSYNAGAGKLIKDRISIRNVINNASIRDSSGSNQNINGSLFKKKGNDLSISKDSNNNNSDNKLRKVKKSYENDSDGISNEKEIDRRVINNSRKYQEEDSKEDKKEIINKEVVDLNNDNEYNDGDVSSNIMNDNKDTFIENTNINVDNIDNENIDQIPKKSTLKSSRQIHHKKNNSHHHIKDIDENMIDMESHNEKNPMNDNQSIPNNKTSSSNNDTNNSPTFKQLKTSIHSINDVNNFPKQTTQSVESNTESNISKIKNTFNKSSIDTISSVSTVKNNQKKKLEIEDNMNYPFMTTTTKKNISNTSMNSLQYSNNSNDGDLMFSFDPNAMQKQLMQNKLKEQLAKTTISSTINNSNSKIPHISHKDLVNAIQEEEPRIGEKKVKNKEEEEEEDEKENNDNKGKSQKKGRTSHRRTSSNTSKGKKKSKRSYTKDEESNQEESDEDEEIEESENEEEVKHIRKISKQKDNPQGIYNKKKVRDNSKTQLNLKRKSKKIISGIKGEESIKKGKKRYNKNQEEEEEEESEEEEYESEEENMSKRRYNTNKNKEPKGISKAKISKGKQSNTARTRRRISKDNEIDGDYNEEDNTLKSYKSTSRRETAKKSKQTMSSGKGRNKDTNSDEEISFEEELADSEDSEIYYKDKVKKGKKIPKKTVSTQRRTYQGKEEEEEIEDNEEEDNDEEYIESERPHTKKIKRIVHHSKKPSKQYNKEEEEYEDNDSNRVRRVQKKKKSTIEHSTINEDSDMKTLSKENTKRSQKRRSKASNSTRSNRENEIQTGERFYSEENSDIEEEIINNKGKPNKNKVYHHKRHHSHYDGSEDNYEEEEEYEESRPIKQSKRGSKTKPSHQYTNEEEEEYTEENFNSLEDHNSIRNNIGKSKLKSVAKPKIKKQKIIHRRTNSGHIQEEIIDDNEEEEDYENEIDSQSNPIQKRKMISKLNIPNEDSNSNNTIENSDRIIHYNQPKKQSLKINSNNDTNNEEYEHEDKLLRNKIISRDKTTPQQANTNKLLPYNREIEQSIKINQRDYQDINNSSTKAPSSKPTNQQLSSIVSNSSSLHQKYSYNQLASSINKSLMNKGNTIDNSQSKSISNCFNSLEEKDSSSSNLTVTNNQSSTQYVPLSIKKPSSQKINESSEYSHNINPSSSIAKVKKPSSTKSEVKTSSEMNNVNMMISPEDTFGINESLTDKDSLNNNFKNKLYQTNQKKSPLSISIPDEEAHIASLSKKKIDSININNIGSNVKNTNTEKNDTQSKNTIVNESGDGENVYTFSNNKRLSKGKINKGEIHSKMQIDNKNNLVYLVSESNEKKKMKINKYMLKYFEYLVMNYMKKKCCQQCIGCILRYQMNKEKGYACKILYRVIKKRVIFYEIKFYHRLVKIYKFLLKYKK